MKEKLIKFMYGRYGNDELNQFLFKLVFVSLVISFLSGTASFLGDIFYFLALIIVVFIYFRMFSKNFNKRYSERTAYLNYYNKVKLSLDKQNKIRQQKKSYAFFKCPSCKQKVRVPKGKGKISIHCPKCGVDFIKRS